jgi:putative ABC transport system ATP-binding protein
MEPIIKFSDLSVVYNLGKTNEVLALKGISGEIYPQEYVIFFGPSGCGKSTLLYAIAGLETPTEGEVSVFGKDLKLLKEVEKQKYHCSSIGMVFQSYHLVPSLTVRDNILLPQMFAKENGSKRIARANLLMERFDIAHLADRKPAKLSGGQQQRVAIARALINDPPIILADEPVGNLDSVSAQTVIDLLSEINKKDKKTIILVTHDPRRLNLADRVIYMEDGKLNRVFINPQRVAGVSKEFQLSELDKLAQVYPYLSESQLRSKLIINHFILPYGIDIQQKIEELINKYLLKEIGEKELLEFLDKPPVSLYSQKAQDLVNKIVPMVKEMEELEKEKNPQQTPLRQRASSLRRYLLDRYSGKMTMSQVYKMDEAILQRIENKINDKKLEEILDLPLNKGGIGLNKRTAKNFVSKLKIVLMKS